MKFEISGIEPMGAVRTTQRQKFKDVRAMRYRNYKMYIGLKVRQHAILNEPTKAALGVEIKFVMPIPKSLKGKVMPGDPHIKKPDLDNLIKGVFDAVNKIIWVDDNQVVDIQASKVYGINPGIELEVSELF